MNPDDEVCGGLGKQISSPSGDIQIDCVLMEAAADMAMWEVALELQTGRDNCLAWEQAVYTRLDQLTPDQRSRAIVLLLARSGEPHDIALRTLTDLKAATS